MTWRLSRHANDHLPVVSETGTGTTPLSEEHTSNPAPDSALLEVITHNNRFLPPKQVPVVICPSAKQVDDFNNSTAVDVLTKATGAATEARGQEVDVIVRALVSCFPRVVPQLWTSSR